jgi:hypothetical protein
LQFLSVKKKKLEKSVIFVFFKPKNLKLKTKILDLTREWPQQPQELKEIKTIIL